MEDNIVSSEASVSEEAVQVGSSPFSFGGRHVDKKLHRCHQLLLEQIHLQVWKLLMLMHKLEGMVFELGKDRLTTSKKR